jgi:hypothetical protein
MDNATRVYDASIDDVKYWNAHGYHHIEYLPPLFSTDVAQKTTASTVIYDLVFLGNLHTDHNISGVIWLLEKVMPIVWRKRSGTTLLIAGSNPNFQFCERLDSIDNVKILVNPTDANEVLLQGRIALNPVTTVGGVQIKNIDMLLSGCPIITRDTGVSGLPADVRKCFIIADSPLEFASAILEVLSNPPLACETKMLNSYFGVDKIKSLLESIEYDLLHHAEEI